MKIHFISGLPRSGSTLLVALLGQNPRFQTGLTLATFGLLQAIEFATSRDNEASLLLNDDQKLALRRGIFTSIYGDTDRVVFDKNHLWCSKMPLIARLFPEAKVIAMVRDLSWVIDSFERLYQSQPLETAAMFDFRAGMTVYKRVSKMAASDGVVGMSLDALKEAYYGDNKDRLLLVEYQNFVTQPAVEMRVIYDFLGEPFFTHDFENVSFSSPQFDAAVGLPGLHTVRGPVKFNQRKTILPLDLFDKFRGDTFWKIHKLPIHDRREIA